MVHVISSKGIKEDVTVILGQCLQAVERGRISDTPWSVALFADQAAPLTAF